jgi:hypothetical protein
MRTRVENAARPRSRIETMTSLRRVLFACVAASAIAGPASTQVTQVPNTGCPNAAYPEFTGSVQLGQSLQFRWSCIVTRFAFAILGSSTGGGIAFHPPLTCVAGPCVFHPGPVGGAYFAFPIQGYTGDWTLPIPNDSRLIGSSWSLQCGCWCG